MQEKGDLYFLNTVKTGKSQTLQQWHETMGHCNFQDILKLESVVTGMKLTDKNQYDCDACAKGKMVQEISRVPDEKAKNPLDFIHCDLAGPVQTTSHNGANYAIIFTDDYSGLIFVYFLKTKDDTTGATKRFLADIAPYGKVKRFRCDNGTEFSSNVYRNLLIEKGIKQEFSCPNSPMQNGTAERGWRTLFSMARCMLADSKLPKSMWSYAVRMAAYIRNRCYSNRTKCTLFELFVSKKPDLSKMHKFGIKCYAYVQNPKKLDDRAQERIYVGRDVSSPAYMVYFPSNHTVRRIRCVKFFENPPPNNLVQSPPCNLEEVYDEFSVPAIAETATTSDDNSTNTATTETVKQLQQVPIPTTLQVPVVR